MNVQCTQYGFIATQKQVENKKIYLTYMKDLHDSF